MSVVITFDVDGEELLITRLEALLAGMRDLSPFLDKAVEKFQEIQREWFASQGDGSWPPLSPDYALWKAINFPGLPLLVLTGDLEASEFTVDMTNEEARLSTNAPEYWIYHQFGTSRMPARPPYVVDDDVQEQLRDAFEDEFREYIRRLYS